MLLSVISLKSGVPVSLKAALASLLMELRLFIEKSSRFAPPLTLIFTFPVAWAEPPRVTIAPVTLSAPAPPKVTTSAAVRLTLAVLPVQVTLLLLSVAPASNEPITLITLAVMSMLLLSALLKRRTPEPILTVPALLTVRFAIPCKSKPCCWYLPLTKIVRPKLILPSVLVWLSSRTSSVPWTKTWPL